MSKHPIAIVGAGFSGTIAAIQLLRALPADQPVLLCERAPQFAQGVAYATRHTEHLLNVRSANMSALPEQPSHFEDWLRRYIPAEPTPEDIHDTAAGTFASRRLYGRYLQSMLDGALRAAAEQARLRLLPDNVLDILPRRAGGYDVVCEHGSVLPVAGVVLAMGNLLPAEDESARICRNPWSARTWRGLEPDGPVLVVGTGLTMVDLVVGLHRQGFKAPIVALSRNGLLPASHAAGRATWPTPAFTRAEQRSIRLLLRRLRAELRAAAAQGADWRAVIDSVRPITAATWAGLPEDERRRFLRHARRYWDVHRHRMAPPHAELLARLQSEGQLSVIAGRVAELRAAADHVDVRIVARTGRGRARAFTRMALRAQRVIMASGSEAIAQSQDRLVRRLIATGLVRLDQQGLGLDVTDHLAIIRADGTVAERVWALGPVVRGVFWECVAVPDIRVQADLLARRIALDMQEHAGAWSFAI